MAQSALAAHFPMALLGGKEAKMGKRGRTKGEMT
jgi:hypothetical protein